MALPTREWPRRPANDPRARRYAITHADTPESVVHMPPNQLITARPDIADERRPPRVGIISFLNCTPIRWGLERSGPRPGLSPLPLSPEAAGDRLVAGHLDLGPISLAEYLRHTDDLLLLPGLAIAADGPVMSCNIVSHRRLEEVPTARVGLTSTSRTTVLLARLLLEERFGLTPGYFTGPPDPAALLRRADAAVVIGDPALRTHFDGARDGLVVHDAAALWTEWTGLPMVFAVWAVRRAYAEQRPHTVAAVHRALLEARDLGLAELERVSAEVSAASGFTAPQLLSYYRTLRYELNTAGLHAIDRFGDLAAARGLLPEHRAIRRFEPRATQ